MTILGEFRAERPPASPEAVVHARVSLTPGRFAEVTFLIDTGADCTMLSPSDTANVLPPGSPLDWENDPSLRRVRGVGAGASRVITRDGVIAFEDEERGLVLQEGVRFFLAEPAAGAGLPSLLGRDVLENFRLTVSTRESQVTLELV